MAEIRCPMCGKSNTAGRDTCQYCQARLTPLRVDAPGPADKQAPPDKPDGDVPDWLRSLRPEEGSEDILGAEPEEENLPDWLNAEPPGEAEDIAGSKHSKIEADVPDWLSDLRQITPEKETSLPAESGESDWWHTEEGEGAAVTGSLENWLAESHPQADASLKTGPEEPEERPATGPSAQLADEEPEWLRRIRQHQREEENPPEEAAPAGPDVRETGQLSLDTPLPEPNIEIPDWLSGAAPAAETPAAASGDQPAADKGDVFRSARAFQTGDLAEWLAGLDAQPAPPAQPPAPEPAATPADHVPDWLSSLAGNNALPAEPAQDEPAAEVEKPVRRAKAFETGDLPGWLFGVEETPTPAEATPGDFTAASPQEAAPLAAVPAPELPVIPEEPDWFTALSAATPVEPAGPEPTPKEKSGEGDLFAAGLPDWLSGSRPPEQAASAAKPPAAAPGDIPDWLKSAGAPPTEPAPAEPAKPSWLDNLEEPGAPIENPVSPFTVEASQADISALDAGPSALPDWLNELPPAEPTEAGEPATPQSTFSTFAPPETAAGQEANLSPAELPGWLEAMRPLETAGSPGVRPDESTGEAETAGPLSGLHGVLPAEPVVGQTQKPPAFSQKMEVSAEDQARAAQLAEMVKTEGDARPVPKRSIMSSQVLVRVAIAVILFAVVLGLSWMGLPPAYTIPSADQEIIPVGQAIDQLGPLAPVLVAFDYQPAFAGEMDGAAAGVINHLMLKGAYLTLVSTTPTGPLQAERLLKTVAQKTNQAYEAPTRYANLGYIPGGQAGILAFAQGPRQTLPVRLDMSPAWESGPLARVSQFENFSMVVVITDNPDVAKAWIEQAGPYYQSCQASGLCSLVVVSSAQAEPLIRPYVQNDPVQVQGMVTGLAGGAAYEWRMNWNGLAQSHWPVFTMSLAAAVLLILVGALLNGAWGQLQKRKETGTEGPA